MRESWVNEAVKYIAPDIYMIIEKKDIDGVKYVKYENESSNCHYEILNVCDMSGELFTKANSITDMTFCQREYQGNIGESFEIDGDIYITPFRLSKVSRENIVNIAWENTKRRLFKK